MKDFLLNVERIFYFKRFEFSSPKFFLLAGFFITAAFIFFPLIYDPFIRKTIAIETINSDSELVDYLESIQDKDNIIIGVHGYLHKSPISENTACEYVCSGEEITLEMTKERLDKGLEIFEKAGLEPSWIAPPGMTYNKNFLNLTEELGYIREVYEVQGYITEIVPLEMVLKPAALGKINNFKQDNLIFKEYTAGWQEEGVDFDQYNKTIALFKKDMTSSIDGLFLHIQDYSGRTEAFIEKAVKDYEEIRFIRVDDVASSQDLPRLKKIVDLADRNNRLLMIAVIPAHKAIKGNPAMDNLIKTTWFVFLPFFFFPLAFMVPLHWYERRKIRKKPAISLTPLSFLTLPRVSLIFPAYNEEKLIGKTIDQGLNQDYQGDLEIIIIDDGSTDKTFEIAQSYALKHPDIVKAYKHKINKGKPAGLNTGFKMATGEISIFSDSDSYLASNLVSKLVPHFKDSKVGMAAGMIVIDNENNLLTKLEQMEYLYNQEIIRFCQATHKGVLICPGAATAVRTQIARDIPSRERTITEDADFTFEVLKAGWKVSQEPEALSWTEAPERLSVFIDQRKRWLYGVLQTIWIHKWALFFKNTKVPNLWVWWAWIGYLTCPVTTIAVLFMPLFYWILGDSYLIFLAWYGLIVALIYGFATWYGLKQYRYEKKTKLMFLFPVYLVYQYLLNVLLFYLVVCFIIRKGVTVHYGGRYIHAV